VQVEDFNTCFEDGRVLKKVERVHKSSTVFLWDVGWDPAAQPVPVATTLPQFVGFVVVQ